jgi:drug/metabolite transporter (DMT)-like permease
MSSAGNAPDAPTTSPSSSPSAIVETRAHQQRVASTLLVVACLFWGLSFAWAKIAGRAVNDLTGAGDGSPTGPMWVLALRHAFAVVVWMTLVPNAWRGWTRAGLVRGLILGGLTAAGMVVQHLGLERADPAVTAFLVSLVVVFVPIISWLAFGRRPGAIVSAGIGLAVVGIWLLTNPGGGGFGLGEALALTASIVWAVYILAIEALSKKETPARLVASQFVITAIVTVGWCVSGAGGIGVKSLLDATAEPVVWRHALLLGIFPTVIGYGILTYFQPKIDATRASLIYLAEPVFGAAAAWMLLGSAMDARQITGAALILVANVVVELLASRARVTVPD